MKKTILFGGLLLAGVALTGAGCGEVGPQQIPEVGTVSSDVTSQGLKSVTETDGILNYTITFPTDVFQSTTFGKEANPGLTSVYYTEDNPSGMPGNEVKHTYSIVFSQKEQSLVDVLKQENQSAYDEVKKHKSGDVFDTGFVASSNVAGKEGYVVTMGAEGTQVKTYYIARSAKQTFMIRLNYIGESQVKNMKPSALSEAKQLEYFNQVLRSFKFSK